MCKNTVLIEEDDEEIEVDASEYESLFYDSLEEETEGEIEVSRIIAMYLN